MAAGGTIGILIPPSGALILYGLLAEVNIAKLFIAGIVPGLISIAFYFVAIRVVCQIKPEWAPRGDRSPWIERIKALRHTWAVFALFLLIMGGIVGGVFTAPEGGGIGAMGALLIAIFRKRMNVRIFFESLLEAGKLAATVFSVAFGALMLNQFVNMAEAPEQILAYINSLGVGPWGVVVVILCCYVLLGMIVDGPAMIFLTVPIFVPLIQALPLHFGSEELKLIWWGIIVVVAVEISLITPPIGMNVFVIASMLPDVSLGQIYRGISAFFIADLARLALFVASPGLVLFLVKALG